MAGGMILMGILIAIMPLPAAMVLHAVTQMASNGWRALLWWRHIRWRPVGFYLLGSALALGRLVAHPVRAEQAGSAYFPWASRRSCSICRRA